MGLPHIHGYHSLLLRSLKVKIFFRDGGKKVFGVDKNDSYRVCGHELYDVASMHDANESAFFY